MIRDMVVTFSDGKLSLPKEVQEEMHLTEGARLRLVSASKSELRLEVAEPSLRETRVDEMLGIDRPWVPNETWRTMRGMLSGHPDHDTSKVRHEERLWELEHDERKFGPLPKR